MGWQGTGVCMGGWSASLGKGKVPAYSAILQTGQVLGFITPAVLPLCFPETGTIQSSVLTLLLHNLCCDADA